MTTPAHEQRKRFKGWRLACLLIGIALCVVALVFGIITTDENLLALVSFVIGPIGVILGLIAWLVPLPLVNEPKSLDTPATNPTPLPPSFTFSSTITISSTNPPNIAINSGQNALPSQQATTSPQSIATPNNSPANPVSTTGNIAVPQHTGSPDLVFRFNATLIDPNEFYGRSFARTTLINRTHNGSSTAIVGERRIGKTWLLNYLMLSAPHDPMLGTNYRIGYLDATSPECHTITDFATKALEALDIMPTTPLRGKADLKTVAVAVTKLYKQQRIRPVLCIDEFEGLGQQSEFDLDFLNGLRSMTQEGLVLITVTRTSLMDAVVSILGEKSRTSPFFNIFYDLTLKPFNEKDAFTFAQAKSVQVGFTEQERQHMLEHSVMYGPNGTKHWYPLKLQLVGRTLLEDKQAGQTDPVCYRPQDVQYWLNFEQRIKEYESFVSL